MAVAAEEEEEGVEGRGRRGGGFGRVEGDDGAVAETGAFAEGCCGGCRFWLLAGVSA